jgi:hypothetical protein
MIKKILAIFILLAFIIALILFINIQIGNILLSTGIFLLTCLIIFLVVRAILWLDD